MKKLPLLTVILTSMSLLVGFTPETNQEELMETDNELATLKDGEKIFLKNVDECLSIIEKEAQKISIQGVAMLAYIPGDKTESWTSKMKVVGKLANEKVNLLAIVYSKASEMAVTLQDSGDEPRKEIVGELGYRGGLIKKVGSGYLVAAFSGAKAQQDVDVSKIGLDWLSEKF